MSVSKPSFSLEELKILGGFKAHHGSHPSDLCCAETQDKKDVSKLCIHLYMMSYTVTVSLYDTFVYDTTAQGNTPQLPKITRIRTCSIILPLSQNIFFPLYFETEGVLVYHIAMSQGLGFCNMSIDSSVNRCVKGISK